MVDLGCSAKNCTYNKNHMCCRGSIEVDGHKATEEEETCCHSFLDKEDQHSVSMGGCCKTPDRFISVGCEATNCVYNDSKICKAEHIDISGCEAEHCQETKCASFMAR